MRIPATLTHCRFLKRPPHLSFLFIVVGTLIVGCGSVREYQWTQTGFMSRIIDLRVTPLVEGSIISEWPPTEPCHIDNGRLVVSHEYADRGLDMQIVQCNVALPVSPRGRCRSYSCIAVHIPEPFFSIPKVRKGIESAIANPCMSVPSHMKEKLRLWSHGPIRDLFMCDEDEAGNVFDVIVVLGEAREGDREISYPATRKP